MGIRFDGKGLKASSQARRYLYGRLAVMLETDLRENDGADVLRYIDNEFDERRLRKEAKKVAAELRKKSLQ